MKMFVQPKGLWVGYYFEKLRILEIASHQIINNPSGYFIREKYTIMIRQNILNTSMQFQSGNQISNIFICKNNIR